jgi:hypothetical protein
MSTKSLVILTVLSGVVFVGWGVFRIVHSVKYGIEVGGHLKRAADANIPSTAAKELKIALDGAKARGVTEGYTSILWRSPSEDIGFWYTNLNESLEELEELPDDATPLEKSNMLMKLRETILDDGSDGVSVTVPNGISVYPSNTLIAIWGTLSGIFVVFFGGWLLFRHS